MRTRGIRTVTVTDPDGTKTEYVPRKKFEAVEDERNSLRRALALAGVRYHFPEQASRLFNMEQVLDQNRAGISESRAVLGVLTEAKDREVETGGES